MHLRTILALDPLKTYTTSDLEDSSILERGLQLVFQRRFGQKGLHAVKLTPHIPYTALSNDIGVSVAAKIMEEEHEYLMNLSIRTAAERYCETSLANPANEI